MGCTHLEFDCGGPNCDATNNDRTAHVKCPDFAPWCNCSNGKHGEPDIPFYSTDIADAWRVVEHAGVLEAYDFLTHSGPRSWIVAYESDGELVKVGEGETAPLAICRAALHAVAEP